jgi:hypothetical protein
MTVDFALRLASAAAQVLVPEGGTVLIGKDTRVSGYMFESALEAGFVAAGVDVLLTGPLPTPAIAYLTNTTESNFTAASVSGPVTRASTASSGGGSAMPIFAQPSAALCRSAQCALPAIATNSP